MNLFLLECSYTSLGVLGAVLHAVGRPGLGWYVWVVSNFIAIIYSQATGQRWQAAMFAVYLLIAVIGIARRMWLHRAMRRAAVSTQVRKMRALRAVFTKEE